MSRQREWQLRHKEMGLCEKCSEPRYRDSVACEKHLRRARELTQKRDGHKPWEPGGVGRIPIEAKNKI